MLKRLIILACAIGLLGFFPLAAIGATYTYYIDINLTDSSGTSRSNLVAFPTINNSTILSHNYFGSSVLNSNLQTGSTNITHGIRDTNTSVYIASLGANQTNSYRYYLGYSPAQTSLSFLSGDNGYGTVADAGSLEPSNLNWSIEWTGYFDATKTGSISEKSLAYGLNSTTGTVTGFVYASDATDYLLPNGAGYTTGGFTLTGCASEWECVDDPVGAPDDNTTYLRTATLRTSAYALQNDIIPSGVYISSVQVRYRAQENVSDGWITPSVYLAGQTTDGTTQELTNSWANYTSSSLARPGGGDWTTGDLNNIEVVCYAAPSGGGTVDITQIYIEITYNTPTTVSAALTTGARSIKLQNVAGTLELLFNTGSGYISQATAVMTNVRNTTATFRILENGPVVYTTMLKIIINGTTVALYQPTTLTSSTTLTDSSASSNHAAITWGTALPSMTSVVSQLQVGSPPSWQNVTSSTTPNYITDTPVTSSYYNPTSGTSGLLFDVYNNTAKPIIIAMQDAGMPPIMDARAWWALFFGILSFAAGFYTYKVYPHGVAALAVAAMVYAVPLTMSIMDIYLYVTYVFAVIGFAMFHRDFSW